MAKGLYTQCLVPARGKTDSAVDVWGEGVVARCSRLSLRAYRGNSTAIITQYRRVNTQSLSSLGSCPSYSSFKNKAFILPYIAVVIANAGRERRSEPVPAFVPTPKRTLAEGSSSTAPQKARGDV